MKTNNPAWAMIDKRADEMVQKSGNKISHAQAVVKFLETDEGRRLYAEGGGAHGYGFDPRLPWEDDGAPRAPVTKKEAAWERIKAKAEVIQKRGLGCSFAKAVDRVLRDNPELYDEYVGR
jgi:hypothetical protein